MSSRVSFRVTINDPNSHFHSQHGFLTLESAESFACKQLGKGLRGIKIHRVTKSVAYDLVASDATLARRGES